ncbi:alpha-hydroxy-acid oxidizing protein, partial [Mycobacterium avium]|uniref:alpha-hydroxy-acid oxidizing protein n=1 Tax=Mycobacterium avium TaxID=1764 RepID=UPI001F2BE2B3
AVPNELFDARPGSASGTRHINTGHRRLSFSPHKFPGGRTTPALAAPFVPHPANERGGGFPPPAQRAGNSRVPAWLARSAPRDVVGGDGQPPVAGIDVAGAGGTSWSRVEQFVRYGELRYPDLADWGVPTARAIVEVRRLLPDIPLVASGGIRTGMDAAKAIALGADVVAVARPLLPAAIESSAAVVDWLQPFIDELRVCLHGCGVADLAGLRAVELIRLA